MNIYCEIYSEYLFIDLLHCNANYVLDALCNIPYTEVRFEGILGAISILKEYAYDAMCALSIQANLVVV